MSDQNNYPSIQLAFEQVKGLLTRQEDTARALDGKASTLFAAGTAVLGIGIPLGFSKLDAAPVWLLVSSSLPVIAYVLAGIFMVLAYKCRTWITLDNPITITNKFLTLNNNTFMHEILLHTKKAFETNDKNLRAKANAVDYLLFAVISETVLMVVLFIFTFWLVSQTG